MKNINHPGLFDDHFLMEKLTNKKGGKIWFLEKTELDLCQATDKKIDFYR